MNKRFLSTLLTGAIFLAATSMFVSCKDYDDDIKNLQAQIDKAALKSEVEALQATLSQVQANAATKAELEAAKTALSADIKKAQDAADAAGQKAAQAISDAAKAQDAADAAQSFAEAVKLTADAAKALAETNKADLATAKKELTALITDAQETADAALALAKAAATKAEFDAAVEKLTKAAADAQATADEALKIAKAAATKAEFDAAVEKLTKAAADAQATADEALEIAKAAATKVELADAKDELKKFAGEVADQAKDAAVLAAKAYANELAEKQAGIDAAQDAAVAAALKNYATNATIEALATSLNEQLDELKDAISKTATEAAFEILSDEVKAYAAQIDVMFAGVTSVELFASYSLSSPLIDYSQIHSYEDYIAYMASMMSSYQRSVFGFMEMYEGEPLIATMYHGTVKENSVFGDEAYKNADQLIEYKAGDEIKDAATLLIRVNPVNADITAADMKLINSLGEDLSDVFVVEGAERFNEMLYGYVETTRGNDINSGLWKVQIKPADGVTPEAWLKAVSTLTDEQIAAEIAGESVRYDKPVGFKKYAIAINNTTEDNADRYVASTFDIMPVYQEYEPTPAFNFNVNDIPVNYIRNRWYENGREEEYYIEPEQQSNYYNYFEKGWGVPELAWDPELFYAEEPTVPATEPTALDAEPANVVEDHNTWVNETRRSYYYHFIYADVNEEFTLNAFNGLFTADQGSLYYGIPGQKIDYYYVVFDKENAVESKPSEWNAWNSYTVEGLGVMTKADQPLTMKITSESAHGDVVGFRVYAVNRDGTLADPDGRAFYVYVGQPGDEFKSAEATVLADKLDAVSTDMDVTGWFKKGAWYHFSPYVEIPENYESANPKNENPDWVWGSDEDDVEKFTLNCCRLTFYDKDGNIIYVSDRYDYDWIEGDDIADAVKVTFTPYRNVANMIDGETYVIYIRQEQEEAPTDYVSSPYATLSITKVLPDTAKELQFRPKQEGKFDANGKWVSADGTGEFMVYMLPNTNEWANPWANAYEQDYAVGDEPRDNGFKDLNNIFYDLNKDDSFEFVFTSSLDMKDGNDPVDLGYYDEAGKFQQGIIFGTPGTEEIYYLLDIETPFIDYTTPHAVNVSTNYAGVSTTVKYDNAGDVDEVNFGKTWKVASEQKLTAYYGCWHHAMHDVAFNKGVSLQWAAEPEEAVTTALSNITTKNSYNSTYFGLSLDKLLEKDWLKLAVDEDGATVEPVLSTEPNAKGQINPYFQPNFTEKDNKVVVEFDQVSVQVDANPTADHTEYLNIFLTDAFGHDIVVCTKVTIKKAASNAPRF